MPVDVGSATFSTAATATAASAALPPARRISRPAAVATRWLDATMPPAGATEPAAPAPPAPAGAGPLGVRVHPGRILPAAHAPAIQRSSRRVTPFMARAYADRSTIGG